MYNDEIPLHILIPLLFEQNKEKNQKSTKIMDNIENEQTIDDISDDEYYDDENESEGFDLSTTTRSSKKLKIYSNMNEKEIEE